MAVEHKAGGSSGEDDSWEKLAEDLLGIDFRKSSAAADVPEIDSLLTSETTPATNPDASADNAASPKPSPFDPVDPGAQIVTDAADESIADEPESAAQDDSAAKPDNKADTFWDPLNAWDWDEGTETAPKTEDRTAPKASSPAGREAVEPTPTASPRYEDSVVSESAADLRDEYIADPDFGFGLMDDEDDVTVGEAAPGGPETIEPAAIEQPAALESRSTESTLLDREQAEVSETKRRRRGRGRRGRGRRPAEAADSAAEKPEQGDSGLSEQAVTEPQIEEAPESDVEGGPSDDSRDKPRTGRHRSSRRRRRPTKDSKSAGQETPAASEPVTADSVTAESDDKNHDSEEPVEVPALADEGESSGRKIPTWEEAISYLKHNPPPESRSRNSGGPTGGRSSGRRRNS